MPENESDRTRLAVEKRNGGRAESLRVLATPGFGRLLATVALFDIGAVVRAVAQSWVIYEITGSNLWVGAVAGVRAIPVLILPLLAGALADKLDRRKLLAAVRLVLVPISLLQAWLIFTGSIEAWNMLVLALCAGATFAFGGPAFSVYVLDLVEPKSVPRATAFITMVENAGEMVGPVLAGGIIAAYGAEYSFGMVAVIYLIGGLVVLTLPRGEHAIDGASTDGKTSYFESVKEGLSHVRRSSTLPWLFLMVVSTNIFGVAIFPLIPDYSANVFDVGSLGFGVMMGVLGGGFAAGSAVVALIGLPRRAAWVILSAELIWDSSMIAFGFSRIYPLSLALLFVMGVAAMFWVISVMHLFQREAKGAMRARVMSLLTVGMGLFPLGWAYGGVLSTVIGNELTLLVSALAGGPIVIAALIASPGLRRS